MSARAREKAREGEWIGTTTTTLTSIQLNRAYEPKYRDWLKERTTRTSKPLYYEEAVYSGAEATGCSPDTSKKYLGKATSPQGDFLLISHTIQGVNKREIVWKHTYLQDKK
jgi:hypothetical protein